MHYCGESEQDRYNNSNNTSTGLAPALSALIVHLLLHLTYRYSSLAYSYTAADVFCHHYTGLHYEEQAQKALSKPTKAGTFFAKNASSLL